MKHFIAEHWSFTPDQRRLKVDEGDPTVLPPQASQLLEALCRAGGEIVSSYTLIDDIWNGNLRVGEQGLRQVVLRLRRAIPDDGSGLPAIINEPRRGYRLRDRVDESELALPRQRRTALIMAALASVVVVLGALFLKRSLDGDPPTPQLAVEQVTARAGFEESPAPSPDGQTLLFSADWNGRFQIYRRQLGSPDTENELFLEHAGHLGGMSWSPDGQSFAYLATTENRDVDDVFLYEPASGRQEKLGQQYVPTFGRAPYGIAWSPRVPQLAFSSLDETGGRTALFLYDRDTGLQRAITEPAFLDLHPAWSPDGNTLSFLRIVNPELSHLVAMDMANGTLQQLTDDNIKIYGHGWLDDGHIVFSGYEHGYFYPFVINVRTGKRIRLEVPGNFKFPRVAGEQIYYVRSALERQIQRLRWTDGGLDLEEIIDSASSQMDPTIHPGSGRMVFTTNRTGRRELWYRPAEDAEFEQLSDFRTAVNFPDISASGRLVLARYFNDERQQVELCLWDLDLRQRLELPEINSFIGHFAGGDRHIAYLVVRDGRRDLWTYDLETGGRRLLAEDVWAPVGANKDEWVIYYLKQGALHFHDLKDGHGGVLTYPTEFASDPEIYGSELFYFRASEAGANLIALDLHSGAERTELQIGKPQFNILKEFSYDPNRQVLYLNITSKNESDIYSLPKKAVMEVVEAALR